MIAPGTMGRIPYRGISVVSPQPKKWDLQAHGVWKSATRLVESIEEVSEKHFKSNLSGDILELGAGSGLSGLSICKTFSPKTMTLSDYPDPDILSTLCANRDYNFGAESADKISVWGHAWGSCRSTPSVADEKSGEFPKQQFDLIIAADVLWMGEQHSNLIHCLHHHLRPSPRSAIFIVCGLHTGRIVVLRFLEAARASGLEVRMLRETRFIPLQGETTTWREWKDERDKESRTEMAFWAAEMVLGFLTV